MLLLEDGERIYRPLTRRGYVRQDFYDSSMTAATFRRETDTASRSLRTVCDYNRGDPKLRSIQVEVEQYRSAKAARAEWASIAYLGTGKESRKLASATSRALPGTSTGSRNSRGRTSATWVASR